MYPSVYAMAVTLGLAAAVLTACDNRREDTRTPATEGSETGEATNRSEGGKLSEADKKAGRVLETPGDSVRLEDTLSIPPASSDTTR